MTTGLNSQTFEHLQLGAGLFLKNFNPDAASSAAELKTLLAQRVANHEGLLGATRGGGTFTCKPALRHVEADGLRTPVKGSAINDGWTVKLTGTLLEITPDAFSDVLACAEKTTMSGVTTLRLRSQVAPEDHIPSLCWIGDTAKGFLLIELTDALSMNGAAFTFTDKGEGTLPFEFQAHQASAAAHTHAPCRIMFFA